MEKYKMLLLRDGGLKYFAITWSREKNAETGDCFVRVINEETKVREGKVCMEIYSEPMTLDELRKYVESQPHLLGADIGRCMGISLDGDKDKKIYFKDPIVMN